MTNKKKNTIRKNTPKFEETFDPQSLITLAPIHNDQIIGNIGSNDILLPIALAKYLYRGKIYVINDENEFKKNIIECTKKYKLGNVKTISSNGNTIALRDNLLDGGVISDYLNKISGIKFLLNEISRITKKSGWISIIDWIPVNSKPDFGPSKSRRISPEKVISVGDSIGLKVITQRMLSEYNYIVILKKTR